MSDIGTPSPEDRAEVQPPRAAPHGTTSPPEPDGPADEGPAPRTSPVSSRSGLRTSHPSWVPGRLLNVVTITALLVLAYSIRLALLPYATIDFTHFFDRWGNSMRARGTGFFATSFANYNPPVLYLYYWGIKSGLSNIAALKFTSLVFEALQAVAVGRAVGLLRGRRLGWTVGLAMLYLPTVLLNGPIWGQVDAVYASLCILALTSLFRGRRWSPWVLLGLAVAFKLQAVFVLPMVVFWLLKRSRPSLDMVLGPLLAAAVWFAMLVPAWIMGRPLGELLGIYADHGATYRMLSQHAPNLYTWLPNSSFDVFRRAGLAMAVAVVGALVALAVQRTPRRPSPELTWRIALALTFSMPFLLPQMHERYFYLAEICAVVVAALAPSRSSITMVLILQLGSWACSESFVFGVPMVLSFPWWGLIYAVLFIWAWGEVFARTITRSPVRSAGTP